jgi:hypothetical protein
MQRRDNLRASADELKTQLAAAVAERDEAVAELEKAEASAERDGAAERSANHGVRGGGGMVAAAR